MYKCLDGTQIPLAKVKIYSEKEKHPDSLYSFQVCDFVVDCRAGEDERSCGNCTFEGNNTALCGWHDISQGSIMWKRGTNGTLVDPGQGPPYDHTTLKSTGHFMYVTQANGTLPSSPARLITPVLQQASSTCTLEFWLSISSYTAEQLLVTLLTDNQVERATLQRFHYTSFVNWTKIEIEIGRVDVSFQIAFDSKITYFWGWVAIDDTRLLHCHLPPIVPPSQCQGDDQFQCTRGSCIPKSRICDMTDDCGDHSDELRTLCSSYRTCTFDVSFCDWRHDNTTEFQWQLHQGTSPSDDTGVGSFSFERSGRMI